MFLCYIRFSKKYPYFQGPEFKISEQQQKSDFLMTY